MLTLDFFKENSAQIPHTTTPCWTLLGDATDLEKIPEHHREQLLFLNKEAADFAYQYLDDLQILDEKLWQPFAHLKFNTQEKLNHFEDDKTLKKWLYQREIAFANWVLVLPNFNSFPMLITWKMLLNYSNDIFAHSDDLLIMDFTQTWYLLHYHEGETTFVKNSKW